MTITLDGTLYKHNNTAIVITDGFGIVTRHNACLTVTDGVIQAEKFGIETATPWHIAENKTSKQSDGFFDKIRDCTLKLYQAQNEMHIPAASSLASADYIISDMWRVYDVDSGRVYDVFHDEEQTEVVNLESVVRNAIRQLDFKEFRDLLGDSLQPIVKIESPSP